MPSNHGKQSSSSLEKLRWPVILLLSIVLILGAAAGSFYLYVLDQERYFNDRYFRLLSSLGNNFTDRFINFEKIFSVASEFTNTVLNKKSEKQNQWKTNLTHFFYQGCFQSSNLQEREAFYASVLCQVPEFSYFNAETTLASKKKPAWPLL